MPVPGDVEMPLSEHIRELRSRLTIVIVPVIILTLLVFLYSGELLQIIWRHSIPADVPTVFLMNIYSPMELIITKLKLSFMFALFIGTPLLIYEMFMFVAKGLYENEKLFFIKVVPLSFILFVAGAVLAYFVVVPLIFKYTMLYSAEAVPRISVIKTLSTIIALVIGIGLIFQFPLLLIFSMKMGLLKPEYLKQKRRIIYALLLAFALLVSPDPSAFSELIIAILLVILFEFSLLMERFF